MAMKKGVLSGMFTGYAFKNEIVKK